MGPFLYLTADLPPTPLFQDEHTENIIPQVSLFNVLEKFNGQTEKEHKTYKDNFIRKYGPDFQLVTNTFKGGKCVRNYLLSSLGYVVISIDSRGSSNRGKAFESHIYKRLGQVELIDQLEVLKQMATEFEYLDLTRVAINGWSYGGYLALRGIMDFPHIFKCAVAGAPVTDWELYDTGYTERYM